MLTIISYFCSIVVEMRTKLTRALFASLLPLNLIPVAGSVLYAVISAMWAMWWVCAEYLSGPMARHLLPWTLLALLLILPSGFLMFMAHASDFITNPAFQLKIGLIFLAGLNAIGFHLGPFARVGAWDTHTVAPVAARLSAALR